MSETPPKQKPYDQEAVVARLIAEQAQTSRILGEIRKAISSDSEFVGLSLIGGIKTIVRRYQEERDKVVELNKELDRLVREKVTRR